MKAIILEQPAHIETHPIRMQEVDTPKPGPGELLVRIAACGVCRSNLHMIEGEWVAAGVPARTPIIPGHEVVGRVAALGPGVAGFKEGDRVGIQPLWSTCLRCEYCLTGREQLCSSKQITGETLDGGYAEYMLANAHHAYLVPDALSDAEAAPLFCPGITAYGALHKARLSPGKRAAVFGIGGVGHMMLQFAKLYGTDIIAVARAKHHLLVSEELGAWRTVDASKADPVAEIRRLGGVDASFVFAPSSAVAQQAIAATRPGGTIVIGATAEIGAFPFVQEKTVVGTLLGTRQQMREVLELAGAGKVKVVYETFPLDQAEEVLTRLKRSDFKARAVLLP